MANHSNASGTTHGFGRALRRAVAVVSVVAMLGAAAPAQADEYDPQRTGHPLRVVAYVLHPIGFTLDWLFFRPAHWIGSRPFLKDFFGHQD